MHQLSYMMYEKKNYKTKECENDLGIFGLYKLQAVMEAIEQLLQILSYSLQNRSMYFLFLFPLVLFLPSIFYPPLLSPITSKPLSLDGYRPVLLETAQIFCENMAISLPYYHQRVFILFSFCISMIALGQQLFDVQD